MLVDMLMEMWGVGLAWEQINSLAKRFARVKGWEGGGRFISKWFISN